MAILNISISDLTAIKLLNSGMEWMRKTKRKVQSNHPFWSFSYSWESSKKSFCDTVLRGQYFLSPIKLFSLSDKQERPAFQYDAPDTLLLKSLALLLKEHMCPHLSWRCTHLAGNGGIKGAVKQIHEAINSGKYRFVFRTDVKSYYDSINPDLLIAMLKEYISDAKIIDIISKYLHRCVHKDGEYKCIDYGIPLGCALSPIMGALYLDKLDRAMEELEKKGIFYVRYMDDWVILAPNRYTFREAIRTVNTILEQLKLIKHPDKTFIGKLSRGFEALGYQFQECIGITGPSKTSIKRFTERYLERQAQYESGESLQEYVKEWLSWAFGGLGDAANYMRCRIDTLIIKINKIVNKHKEYEYTIVNKKNIPDFSIAYNV